MWRLSTGLMLLATVALTGTASAAEVFYVHAAKARVTAGPLINAELLGVESRGFRFLASGRQGNWIKLNYKGRGGYLPAINATTSPVPEKQFKLHGKQDEVRVNSRERVSVAPAIVAGTKGLTYEERSRLGKGEKVDYEALEKIERIEVSAAEQERFAAGGAP